MDPVVIWAATACLVASAAIGIRARMLRPKQRTWTAAPPLVCVWLSLFALGLLMNAAAIWFDRAANAREAMVYSLLAAVSLVMLWNLHRNGKAEDVKREAFKREAELAMEIGGPPKPVPWERAS